MAHFLQDAGRRIQTRTFSSNAPSPMVIHERKIGNHGNHDLAEEKLSGKAPQRASPKHRKPTPKLSLW
jgi:hypothetical protein